MTTENVPAELPEQNYDKQARPLNAIHCPFCRSMDLLVGRESEYVSNQHVFCPNCGASGPYKQGINWNTRTQPPAATVDARERAQEIVGNVHNYYDAERGELAWGAFSNLTRRIASALAAISSPPATTGHPPSRARLENQAENIIYAPTTDTRPLAQRIADALEVAHKSTIPAASGPLDAESIRNAALEEAAKVANDARFDEGGVDFRDIRNRIRALSTITNAATGAQTCPTLPLSSRR